MKMEFNLVGILQGDKRVPQAVSRQKVYLRDTKLFFVSTNGTKYRKTTGRPVGVDWPLYTLEVETVKTLEQYQKDNK